MNHSVVVSLYSVTILFIVSDSSCSKLALSCFWDYIIFMNSLSLLVFRMLDSRELIGLVNQQQWYKTYEESKVFSTKKAWHGKVVPKFNLFFYYTKVVNIYDFNVFNLFYTNYNFFEWNKNVSSMSFEELILLSLECMLDWILTYPNIYGLHGRKYCSLYLFYIPSSLERPLCSVTLSLRILVLKKKMS